MKLKMVLVSSSRYMYLVFLGGKSASCQCCTKQPLGPEALAGQNQYVLWELSCKQAP